jgi:hypothetical protein
MKLVRSIYALVAAVFHFLLIRIGGEVFAQGMMTTAQILLKLLQQTKN